MAFKCIPTGVVVLVGTLKLVVGLVGPLKSVDGLVGPLKSLLGLVGTGGEVRADVARLF